MAERDNSMDEPVTSDRIPDILKMGEIQSDFAQSLHTDVIDAVTISQQRARWTLSRVAGFLHSDSKITLGIKPLTTTQAFYPLNVGVSNLIQSATLTIGQEVVCSVDDYSDFHAYQSMFVTNENNKEREQYLSQRCMSHGPHYDNRIANVTDKPPNSAKKVGLDLGRNSVVNIANDVGATQLLPFQFNDATSAQTIADAPVYSVYLSDLFPFLKENSLPTFLIDDEIHIDLVFKSELGSLGAGGTARSLRMCVGGAQNETVAYQIDTNECKLIYDSVMYDGAVMAKYAADREKEGGLKFSYKDYRLAKRTGAQAAFQNLTFPVGGNGRLVTKVFFGLSADANFTPRSLLNGNNYKASALAKKLSVNLLYNDLFEFNTDRSNPALLFHTTQQAEGMVPMVTKDEWKINGTAMSQSNALTPELFMGYAPSTSATGLGSNFQWIAIRPNKGQRVNNKGMDLVYKNDTLGAGTFTLRCYVELMKTATIKNGKFQCYFS
tara:strand:+ start:1541 stop:3022 length:1482 start_codon:yes stop_codon:yes gene_type:complete